MGFYLGFYITPVNISSDSHIVVPAEVCQNRTLLVRSLQAHCREFSNRCRTGASFTLPRVFEGLGFALIPKPETQSPKL